MANEWIIVTNSNGDKAVYNLKYITGIREYHEDRRKSVLDFADGTWLLVQENISELVEVDDGK